MPRLKLDGFIERAYVNEISQKLNSQSTAPYGLVACAGMFGVGKSFIASYYYHTQKDTYTYRIWLSAPTKETLINAYVELAPDLGIKIAEKIDPEKIAQKVKNFLENNPGWLLVIDDAPEQNQIDEWLPSQGGDILVTSRSPHWENVIAIKEMQEDEANRFITKFTQLSTEQSITQGNDIEKLASELGYLPLALAQACSTIAIIPGKTIAKYLQDYSTKKRALLSNNRFPPGHGNHPSVVITWDLLKTSLVERAKTDNLPVEECLNWISTVDAVNIPYEMMEKLLSTNRDITDLSSSPPSSTLSLLFDFSVINWDESQQFFSMHRVPHDLLREETKVTRASLEAFAHTIVQIFPAYLNTLEDYQKNLRYLSHFIQFEKLYARFVDDMLDEIKSISDLKNNLDAISAYIQVWHEIIQIYDRASFLDKKNQALNEQKIIVDKAYEKFLQLNFNHSPEYVLFSIFRAKIEEEFWNYGEAVKILESSFKIMKDFQNTDGRRYFLHQLGLHLSEAYGKNKEWDKQIQLVEETILPYFLEKKGEDNLFVAVAYRHLAQGYGAKENIQKQNEYLGKAEKVVANVGLGKHHPIRRGIQADKLDFSMMLLQKDEYSHILPKQIHQIIDEQAQIIQDIQGENSPGLALLDQYKKFENFFAQKDKIDKGAMEISKQKNKIDENFSKENTKFIKTQAILKTLQSSYTEFVNAASKSADCKEIFEKLKNMKKQAELFNQLTEESDINKIKIPIITRKEEIENYLTLNANYYKNFSSLIINIWHQLANQFKNINYLHEQDSLDLLEKTKKLAEESTQKNNELKQILYEIIVFHEKFGITNQMKDGLNRIFFVINAGLVADPLLFYKKLQEDKNINSAHVKTLLSFFLGKYYLLNNNINAAQEAFQDALKILANTDDSSIHYWMLELMYYQTLILSYQKKYGEAINAIMIGLNKLINSTSNFSSDENHVFYPIDYQMIVEDESIRDWIIKSHNKNEIVMPYVILFFYQLSNMFKTEFSSDWDNDLVKTIEAIVKLPAEFIIVCLEASLEHHDAEIKSITTKIVKTLIELLSDPNYIIARSSALYERLKILEVKMSTINTINLFPHFPETKTNCLPSESNKDKCISENQAETSGAYQPTPSKEGSILLPGADAGELVWFPSERREAHNHLQRLLDKATNSFTALTPLFSSNQHLKSLALEHKAIRYVQYDIHREESISYHPVTNAPIFRYLAYEKQTYRGHVDFYQHPLLCVSADKTRHNVLSTSGIFNTWVQDISPDNIAEICAAVPPTEWESMTQIMQRSALQSVPYGVLRGMSQVFNAYIQQKESGHPLHAQVLSKLFFYICLYLHFLYCHFENSSFLSATEQAAVRTSQWVFLELILLGVACICQWLRGFLEEHGWKKSNHIVNNTAPVLISSGLYAYQIYHQGPLGTCVGTAVGIGTEIATAFIGKTLLLSARSTSTSVPAEQAEGKLNPPSLKASRNHQGLPMIS